MEFQRMDLEKHDSNKVSEIIYEADANTFNFFFGNKKNASEKIEKLVNAGDNNLGYQQTYVVTNEGNHILGVMVYATRVRNDNIRQSKVILKNFAIVAVDEDSRGQGIGSLIIKEGIKLARKQGCKRVVLDVDFENKGALRFYEKLGFTIFNTKSISIFRWEEGVYNMEYLLND